MYKKEYSFIHITENHLKVLALFTIGEKRWYIREVHKKLELSPRTAQLILEDFEHKAILFSDVKGKIKEYSLNKKSPHCKAYIIFAEYYKRLLFLQTHPFLREVLEKIIETCEGMVILFGSYAKENEKKESDVDLFIVGKCNLKKIQEYSQVYSITISPKIYPLKIFQQKKKKDFLIKEVLEHHIILKGTEDYVSEVFVW